MANILYGTTFISEDEPCMGLYEINDQCPGNHGFHRYQIIYVMRGDKPAEYRHDMGPATKWKGIDQFRIPGGVWNYSSRKYEVVETVGRLRECAESLRRGPPLFDKRELVGLNKIRV